MLANIAEKPFDDQNWLFEVKWDGYRAISVIDKGNVRIYSRNGILLNDRFLPIVESLSKMNPENAILDGEIVVLDREGRSEFGLIQNYLKNGKGIPYYYIFDLLYLEKYDLKNVKLEIRKKILNEVILENYQVLSGNIKNIRVSEHIEKTGKSFFEAALENKLEGIMAKSKDSKYEPGTRSRNWLKIKIRHKDEFVICGFITDENTKDRIVSLITGTNKNGSLVYSGLVGSGFKAGDRKELYGLLSALKSPGNPFGSFMPEKINGTLHWVKPSLMTQIEYSEMTENGIMRHPVYLGLRIDKTYLPENKGGLDTAIVLSNPEKIFWPDEKITKGDLFDYYKKISPFILPYIKDRPQSLNRCPDGINGECFYQKDIDYKLPTGLLTKKIYSETKNEYTDYLICNGPESLLYMVNLGCIDIHPWSSRTQNIEMPDYAIIDLDPLDVEFSEVLSVARNLKYMLDEINCPAFCKTSGSRGVHIYIPAGAEYSFGQVLDFIRILARIINLEKPDITSIERLPEKRHGKIYIDCFQNKIGATVAAPYCIRPKAGAPVSTPLEWKELSENIKPADFNMKNIFERLERTGDIWKSFFEQSFDMSKSLLKLQKLYRNIFI
jgi:bifunctional non-homologous end joining protein LigD